MRMVAGAPCGCRLSSAGLRANDSDDAFLLPGQKPDTLTNNISPVNSFRVILNHYFDGNYKLLETKHFDIPRGYKAPFDQIDVTKDYSDNQN